MTELKIQKIRRWGLIFLGTGILGLLVPTISSIVLAQRKFEDELNILAHEQATYLLFPTDGGYTAPNPTPDFELREVKNRLIIEKASVDMPLFTGTSEDLLSKGGWIFPGTSTPDKNGNTVIFAHRFKYLPPISNTFFHLDRLKTGDEFTISWQNKGYRYQVDEIKIIEPTDLSVLFPSKEAVVTLITCTPIFSTKQRLVVVAHRL